MIFDVRLKDGIATFTCALEDYDEGPTYTKYFSMFDGKLDGGVWSCPDARRLGQLKVPPWALRLAKVLEPRIEAMLVTGVPADLRRWIDDQLLEELEKEKANETAAA